MCDTARREMLAAFVVELLLDDHTNKGEAAYAKYLPVSEYQRPGLFICGVYTSCMR